jgi:hypothetical protein
MQSGDEWLEFRAWRPVCAPYRYVCSSVVRRPIAPAGWIAIKDRKPEFPCTLGRYNPEGGWNTNADHYWEGWTHWLPHPPPPPQPDPAEQAFLEWDKRLVNPSYDHDYHKAAFLAGWKARGEK